MLAAAMVVIVGIAQRDRRAPRLAFWFEDISAETRGAVHERLGSGITVAEMTMIQSVSHAEIGRAFEPYRVELSGRGQATYRVRVVDALNHPSAPSGESHVIVGLGGQGFVNFTLLAHAAAAHAPEGASRQDIVRGIGRGIGRAAVHEFAHQILGGAARIDGATDPGSYEFGSAQRPEQYYGTLRWTIAGPLLRERLGARAQD